MTTMASRPTHDSGDLELELRVLPGVVGVGMVPPGPDQPGRVTVVSVDPVPTLRDDVAKIAQLHLVDASVEIVDLGVREQVVDPVAPSGERRVVLRRAAFTEETGSCEVVLSSPTGEGVGRVSVGPLIGGATATLEALDRLGVPCPFYLLSACRTSALGDAPVIVVLRPFDGGKNRIGVALGDSDVESSSRATLNAINRDLTR